MTRREAKTIGKERLKGNWGMAILALLIYFLITGAVGFSGILYLLFGSMLLIGVYSFFLNLPKEDKLDTLFCGFKEGLGERIVLSLLKQIFITLWSMLLIIPGIVKTYSYALTEFISMDDPTKDGNQCITESRKAMNGKKLELFLFDLSFIGWFLLSILTFGLLLFYVYPYYFSSRTAYLESIAKEAGYSTSKVIDA